MNISFDVNTNNIVKKYTVKLNLFEFINRNS